MEPFSRPAIAAAWFRLLTLRRTDGSAISGSDGSLLLLMLLPLLLWIAVDLVMAGDGAEFYVYNVPTLALIAIALLLLSLVFTRKAWPPVEFRRVLAIVLAIVPIVIVAAAAIEEFLSSYLRVGAYLLLLAYTILYFWRALFALTGIGQLRALAFGIPLVAAFWMISEGSYLDAHVWYAPDDAEEPADNSRIARARAETLLFAQRDRIDAELAAIKRPKGASSALFFVGFAGVGEQRVFAEEIQLAAKVVNDRYDIDNRSLFLINDRRDLDSYPLATVSGLRYALKHLAAKMDVAHDVLFLALSSHGSAAPLLSVSNSSLPLNNVTDDNLAAALRDSGIKWRVIVISACYSGAFIESLRNPYTVILTASAADKTSFGCSDDRDLTYFGEAFYRDALPQSESLASAFEAAKAAIAEREKAEGDTPSEPQAFFGSEFRKAFPNY